MNITDVKVDNDGVLMGFAYHDAEIKTIVIQKDRCIVNLHNLSSQDVAIEISGCLKSIVSLQEQNVICNIYEIAQDKWLENYSIDEKTWQLFFGIESKVDYVKQSLISLSEQAESLKLIIFEMASGSPVQFICKEILVRIAHKTAS